MGAVVEIDNAPLVEDDHVPGGQRVQDARLERGRGRGSPRLREGDHDRPTRGQLLLGARCLGLCSSIQHGQFSLIVACSDELIVSV